LKPTEPKNDNLAIRTLKTGALVALGGMLWLRMLGHPAWGWGFLAGSLLSLFSLFTLMVVIPFLLRPGGGQLSVALLMVTLLMKLPLYAVGLYIAVRLSGNAPLSAFAGLTLAPAVITLKTLGGLMTAKQADRKQRARVTTIRERMTADDALPAHNAARPIPAELVGRGG